MTTRGYSSKVIARAREHRRAGWNYTQISRLLEREYAVRPHRTLVAYWCDPVQRERRAAYDRTRRPGAGKLAAARTEGWKLETMRALRAAGLSFRVIGVVAGVWWGEELSVEQVRYRLREYGL